MSKLKSFPAVDMVVEIGEGDGAYFGRVLEKEENILLLEVLYCGRLTRVRDSMQCKRVLEIPGAAGREDFLYLLVKERKAKPFEILPYIHGDATILRFKDFFYDEDFARLVRKLSPSAVMKITEERYSTYAMGALIALSGRLQEAQDVTRFLSWSRNPRVTVATLMRFIRRRKWDVVRAVCEDPEITLPLEVTRLRNALNKMPDKPASVKKVIDLENRRARERTQESRRWQRSYVPPLVSTYDTD